MEKIVVIRVTVIKMNDPAYLIVLEKTCQEIQANLSRQKDMIAAIHSAAAAISPASYKAERAALELAWYDNQLYRLARSLAKMKNENESVTPLPPPTNDKSPHHPKNPA